MVCMAIYAIIAIPYIEAVRLRRKEIMYGSKHHGSPARPGRTTRKDKLSLRQLSQDHGGSKPEDSGDHWVAEFP